jgi:hypothetical protein
MFSVFKDLAHMGASSFNTTFRFLFIVNFGLELCRYLQNLQEINRDDGLNLRAAIVTARLWEAPGFKAEVKFRRS